MHMFGRIVLLTILQLVTMCQIMHDAYIGRHSKNNIKCVLHDDLGRKNRTTRYNYNCRFSATSLAFQVIFSVS